jgi:hypothetical protein
MASIYYPHSSVPCHVYHTIFPTVAYLVTLKNWKKKGASLNTAISKSWKYKATDITRVLNIYNKTKSPEYTNITCMMYRNQFSYIQTKPINKGGIERIVQYDLKVVT